MATTNSASFQSHIEKILENVAIKSNITNMQIKYELDGFKGEGYLSAINSVEVIGSNKKQSLILKTATKDPGVRSKLPIVESFRCEIYFYDKVMPIYKTLQADLNTPFEAVPKCYYTSCLEYEEILVLENLLKNGYENWNRLQPMAPSNVEMVLSEYGKFHANSYVLKMKQSKVYDEVVTGLGDNMYNWLKHGRLVHACEKLCGKYKLKINDKLFEKQFASFCDGIQHFMLEYDYTVDPYAVISHADCWSSNMMFKYEIKNGIKVLTNMRFIDFQVCRPSSQIFDISQYLCTCADELIWDNLDYYLQIYYNSLSNHMKQMKIDSSKIIEFPVFMQEFKKNCKYGLIISALFLKTTLLEASEAPSMDDGCTDFLDLFTDDIKNQDLYDKRFDYLVKYFFKHDML